MLLDPNFIQNQITMFINHVSHLDKETLITYLYPIWLYIITEAATRGHGRRRAYSRRHH